jgi:hypothetical protein
MGCEPRERPRVNVNTTDATTGATALLLPAQDTHTLHDPIRDAEHARALAALRTVWASAAWMAEVEMLATWCVRKLRGDARPSPYRVLSVAPGRRVWRARRRRMTKNKEWT